MWQLQDEGLPIRVGEVIRATGINPRHLTLEMTESILLENAESTIEKLNDLRDLGVRLAIDDFGTGYSSLRNLISFPFSKMKLDRSFVHDLVINPKSRAIAKAALSIAKALNISIVTEGVENREQAESLDAMGFDYLQGFLFSPPLPAGQEFEFLRNRKQKEVLAVA
mgnify:CR=1 FL=1